MNRLFILHTFKEQGDAILCMVFNQGGIKDGKQ